ncbi:general secretion pathway protein GspD [Vibrio sp. 10N.222.52.B12]|uniref:type II and III secretion system protein family protein n=1 Tax=Vibrio sp. 10N.222.52.B12 TaxID=1880840 RepID=UPI000C842B92|nr:pilus assembly protein N-terminal domain-containing protein [Vibrio sp. 10N.222.52.B12]PMO38262.1 general secretion pathway protein GspD [Vibrio sp. 10N.222.52.B12]
MFNKNILTVTLGLVLLLPLSVSAGELLSLDKGAAKTINVKRNIDTVFVADTQIADYKVIANGKLVIYGIGRGATSIIAYDRAGNEIYNAEVVVNKSLRLLKQTLIARYPDEDIKLTNIGEQIVIDGVVSSEEIKNKVYRHVGEMLKKSKQRNTFELTNASGESGDALDYTATYVFEDIINNLKVLTTDQINVKLTVAEVSSSFLTELGVSYAEQNGKSIGDAGKFVNKILDFSAQDIVAVISASGNDSIGQVLAEPNLSVISGESASFLVGGEIPITVRDNDGVSVTYKEYGVKLSMVAKVTDSENIRLSLVPEVSSIDKANGVNSGLISVPSLRTRKAQTTVQLKDGQSFVLAGLLTSEEQESLAKIPYLGDIPILGALFSKTNTERRKTELIIVATVNLVDPVKETDIKLPKFERTSDLERLLKLDLSDVDDEELENTIKAGGFN